MQQLTASSSNDWNALAIKYNWEELEVFYPEAAAKAVVCMKKEYWSKVKPKDFKDLSNWPSGSLHLIQKYIGQAELNGYLHKIVQNVSELFSVGRGMNEVQREIVIELIQDDYMHYTIADFKLFSKMAVKGDFGITFDRFDGQVLMQMLGEYDRQKMAWLEHNQVDPDKKELTIEDIIPKPNNQKLLGRGQYYDHLEETKKLLFKLAKKKIAKYHREEDTKVFHSIESYLYKQYMAELKEEHEDRKTIGALADLAKAKVKAKMEELMEQWKKESLLNEEEDQKLFIQLKYYDHLEELNKSYEKGTFKKHDASGIQSHAARNGQRSEGQSEDRKANSPSAAQEI